MNKILIVVGGGLGDQVCAEPTIRYATENMPELEISVLTELPQLFKHLKRVKQLIKAGDAISDFNIKDYTVRATYPDQLEDLGKVLCSVHTNGVDYCAMMALKWNLPVAYKEINLFGEHPGIHNKDEDIAFVAERIGHDAVLLHPGRSWPSKTFPADWWNEVALNVTSLGGCPVWIGKEIGPTGTVEVDKNKAVDLRGKLSLPQLIWMLQKTNVVLTNDSAPLHIAASTNGRNDGVGEAWIGMLSTAKHPDYLLQYRKGQLGWRMENLTHGGVYSQGLLAQQDAKSCTSEDMAKWLPQPWAVAKWACDRIR